MPSTGQDPLGSCVLIKATTPIGPLSCSRVVNEESWNRPTEHKANQGCDARMTMFVKPYLREEGNQIGVLLPYQVRGHRLRPDTEWTSKPCVELTS